jgi:uncharacterized protein (TIGR02266 family)
MKLPVVVTKSHQGKSLELDAKRETIALLDERGESLGMVSWGAIIDYISFSKQQSRPAEARRQPRVSLTARIRYVTPSGTQMESHATGVGGGGLFIESADPLPIGTELTVLFALPDRPNNWLEARGRVSWVCPKPDQYTFFPGMGVRFTAIAPDMQAQLLGFVDTLKKTS